MAKQENPQAKKYNRYLKKYIGTYRVKAEYDTSTNDFPRDMLGNIDEDFEDFYIPCGKGRIKHAYCDVLYWYTDKVSQGKNILKEINDTYKGIVIKYEYTSQDFLIYFNDENIDKIAEIVSPRTSGAKIQPLSVRNLPKESYDIPKEDADKLSILLSEYDKVDKMRIMLKATKEFDSIIQATKGKKYNVSQERKSSGLKNKNFIHSLGMWNEFLEFLNKTKDV